MGNAGYFNSIGVSAESGEGAQLAIKLLWAFLKWVETTWDLEITRGSFKETEKGRGVSTLFLGFLDGEEVRDDNKDWEITAEAIFERILSREICLSRMQR